MSRSFEQYCASFEKGVSDPETTCFQRARGLTGERRRASVLSLTAGPAVKFERANARRGAERKGKQTLGRNSLQKLYHPCSPLPLLGTSFSDSRCAISAISFGYKRQQLHLLHLLPGWSSRGVMMASSSVTPWPSIDAKDEKYSRDKPQMKLAVAFLNERFSDCTIRVYCSSMAGRLSPQGLSSLLSIYAVHRKARLRTILAGLIHALAGSKMIRSSAQFLPVSLLRRWIIHVVAFCCFAPSYHR